MQGDRRAAGRTGTFGHGKIHAVLALPVHRSSALAEGEGLDLDLVGDHEYGIKAEAEVADNAGILLVFVLGIFLEEALRAGEGDLIDICLDLVLGHAHAVVDEAQLLRRLIDLYANRAARCAGIIHHAQLGDRIAAVGNDFADEDVLVGIEPLFDDGHDILCIDGDAAGNRIHTIIPPLRQA